MLLLSNPNTPCPQSFPVSTKWMTVQPQDLLYGSVSQWHRPRTAKLPSHSPMGLLKAKGDVTWRTSLKHPGQTFSTTRLISEGWWTPTAQCLDRAFPRQADFFTSAIWFFSLGPNLAPDLSRCNSHKWKAEFLRRVPGAVGSWCPAELTPTQQPRFALRIPQVITAIVRKFRLNFPNCYFNNMIVIL